MKYSAKPSAEVPPTQSPVTPRPENYLRDALTETINRDEPLYFDFLVQVRHEGDDFGVDNESIENASSEWKESDYPFISVAKITISAPQSEVDSAENKAHCEKLAFTPWHSLTEHQPIGSINRLRQSVYQASAEHRLE
jgi:catalase